MTSAFTHRLLCLAAFTLTASAAVAQAPLTLFNGTSLLGWNPHGQWTANAGVLGTSGTLPRSVVTAVPFADFNLVFDYNESSVMGARLRVWAPREGNGGSAIDLDGAAAAPGVGGIEGGSPSHIAPFAGGGWHHVQVEAVGGRLTVHVDGALGGTSGGSGPRAGYIAFEATGNGSLQIRGVKLILAGLTPAFNGSDLGSWKSVAQGPKSGGGVGHDVAKTLTFGIGGGSTKPHAAKWTVQGGAMQGEDGPGGLEYNTPVEDAIVQVTAGIKGSPKPEHFTSLDLRNTAGQLEGGYPVGVGPYSGSIANLAKHPTVPGGLVEETIVIAGRTIAIWVAGNLTTVNTDPRPEAQRVAQGARTAAGSAAFVIPNDVQLNVKSVSITPLSGSYGAAGQPKASSTSIAAAGAGAAAGAPSAAAPAAPSAAENAFMEQQKAASKQAEQDRQSKQRVSSLMAMALATSDPAKQMDYYNQVVVLDPSNAPAVQGYRDAQTKVQAAQAAQDQQIATQVNQQHDSLTKDQQVNASLVKAQSSFLTGHIGEASSALMVAERLAPDNPLVRDLRTRINATSSLRSRLFYLSGGAGLLALIAATGLWIRRRRQQRFPMLEITRGLDTGEQFPINKDTIRIGAVAQDGGQKNDIVVRDIERAISRFHCEIAKKNGQLYVTDLKSSNGTSLDGKLLPAGQPALLRKGNRIQLADSVELRFGYGRQDKKS